MKLKRYARYMYLQSMSNFTLKVIPRKQKKELNEKNAETEVLKRFSPIENISGGQLAFHSFEDRLRFALPRRPGY